MQIQYASSCLVYYVAHLDSKARHMASRSVSPAQLLNNTIAYTANMHQYTASCTLWSNLQDRIMRLCWFQPFCRGYELPRSAAPENLLKKNVAIFCHVAIMFLYLGVSFVICLSVGCGMVLSCSVMVCHFCMLQMPGSKKRMNYRTINKIRGKVRFWALSGRIANAALQQKRNEYNEF